MKPYHLLGVIVDKDNRHVFYLLRDVSGGKSLKDTDPTKPSIRVNPEEFKTLVGDHKVQLFELNGDEVIVSYTDEEKKEYAKTLKKSPLITNEQYWKSEATFYNGALSAEYGLSISLVCCRQAALIKTFVIQCAVYAPKMSDTTSALFKRSCMMAVPTAGDFFLCNWDKSRMDEFIYQCEEPISINTNTMRNLDNSLYACKMVGMKTPELSVVRGLADHFDDLSTAPPVAGSLAPAPHSGVHKMSLG